MTFPPLPTVGETPWHDKLAAWATAVESQIEALSDTLVTSPVVGRIVAVREGEPAPTLLDGDLVVRYKDPGLSYFTDFSEYPVGQHPADWSIPFDAGSWQVVEHPDDPGNVLRRVSNSDAKRRVITWDAVAGDPDRADVEILFKWCGYDSPSYGTVGAAVRTSGLSAETATMVRAGAFSRASQRIQRIVAGVTGELVTTVSANFSGWQITRFRAEGQTFSVKTWADGNPEPAAWDASGTNSLAPSAAGGVGLYFGATGQQDIDWVAVATGGRTAAKP